MAVMGKKGFKYLGSLTGACILIATALYGALAWSEEAPVPDHVFFQGLRSRPLVIAHRGGAGLWPENTLHAFESASTLGVDMIETDIRGTADGVLVVLHDASVDRTTDGTGAVGEMTLAELKKLDAAYRWTPDGGRSFPLRGRNITVPTLDEVFAQLPEMRFNIEPKQVTPSLVPSLCRTIRERRMSGKVIVGSFRDTVLDEFRRACPEVATSASPSEVSRFVAMQTAGLSRSFNPAMQALQVPEYGAGIHILTPGFITSAHERNLEVHAWTVNEVADMRRLIDLKLDGIMTDYPDRLMKLLDRLPK
jgi:glycerophosphoryl diester phosphodiesterase